MSIQDDVYHEALGIISDTCQEYTNLAHRILDRWDEWEFIERFDHRTLQIAHDTIAAAWRFLCLPSLRQMEFSFDCEHAGSPDFAGHWLSWLQGEVRSWKGSPYLIHLTTKILRNQNTQAGYAAESDLARELVARYSEVPWEGRRKDIADAAIETG